MDRRIRWKEEKKKKRVASPDDRLLERKEKKDPGKPPRSDVRNNIEDLKSKRKSSAQKS